MLSLITGVPGAGKTSNTLWEFLQDKSGRPKFCTPIRGFDPILHGVGELESLDHWQDLPDGSLVLVDECQQYLRPRKTGGQVPDWIAAFETHRHRGFDFWFITQNPGLIDSHVRKLVQSHVHFHRAFNTKASTRYEWEQIQPNPDLEGVKAKGLSRRVTPNSEVFKVYESTVLDTHKARLPWKWIITLGVALAVVLAVFLYMRHWAAGLGASQGIEPAPAAAVAGSGGVGFAAPPALSHSSIEAMIPRVPGMPWTARQYDDLTQPTDFPRIAACVQSPRSGCNCYTQQATRLDIPWHVCSNIVKQGIFDPWLAGRGADRPGLSNGPVSEPRSLAVGVPSAVAVGSDTDYPAPL